MQAGKAVRPVSGSLNARALGGWLATVLATLFTSFWVFWGVAEGVEGFIHLLTAGILLLLTLLAISRSRTGGWFMMGFGTVFFVWLLQVLLTWASRMREAGIAVPDLVFWSMVGVGLLPIAAGLLFLYARPEPRHQRLQRVIAIGIPVAVGLMTAIISSFLGWVSP